MKLLMDTHTFDRLLIAQANVEDAGLLSSDPAFGKYPVRLFW